MPAFPPPNPNQFARHWFRGVFIHESGRSEGPFQVAIDLNPNGTRRLAGYVIGDDAVAKRLLFPRGRLKVISADGDDTKITVQGVHIGHRYTQSGSIPEFSRLVAEFSANTAVIEYRDIPKPSETAVVFNLNGPRRFWPAWESSAGEYSDHEFALDGFSFDVRPIVLSQRRKTEEAPQRSKTIIQLTVRPPEAANLTAEQVVAKSTELVDDVLTVMSFLHRGRIHWHERHLHMNGSWVRTNRGHLISRKDRRDPMWEWPIVDIRHIYDFIQKGVESLRRWREAEHPLELSIAYRINGATSRTITQQFTTLFLSLESLKTTYAKRKGADHNIPDRQFRDVVKPAIDNAILGCSALTTDQQKLMIAKTAELNRPSFRTVLTQLASEYRVAWTDLYPLGKAPDDLADFIAVRNRVFHGSSAVSEHRIVRESDRLQILLDRLLLRMLGWEDISGVRPIHFEWLRHQWQAEPIS